MAAGDLLQVEAQEGESVPVGLRQLGDGLVQRRDAIRVVGVPGSVHEHLPHRGRDQRLAEVAEEILDASVVFPQAGAPFALHEFLFEIFDLLLAARDSIEPHLDQPAGFHLIDTVDDEGGDHGRVERCEVRDGGTLVPGGGAARRVSARQWHLVLALLVSRGLAVSALEASLGKLDSFTAGT